MKSIVLVAVILISVAILRLWIWGPPEVYLTYKYGARFNSERVSKNIPILPVSWLCGDASSGWVLCQPENNASIHIGKEIEFENWHIAKERDTFKKKKGDDEYYYLKTTYSYLNNEWLCDLSMLVKNKVTNTHLISKETADSLVNSWKETSLVGL